MAMIIIGYVLASLGGFIGILLGVKLRGNPSPVDEKHGNRIIVLGIAMMAVWIVVWIGMSALPRPPSAVAVVEKGTVYPIPAGNYVYLAFTINPQSIRITGAFTATNRVTFYIMTPSQFSSFSASISISYIYTSGSVLQRSLEVGLAKSTSETYYLVFFNDSYDLSTSVTITQSITVSGT